MTEKKKVLFVDDEPNVLMGLRRMLRPLRNQWDMSFAESGSAALDAMAEQGFDVVVSDMRMPEMDGAELLGRVKDKYPNTVRIVLSGQAHKETILRSIGPSHQYLAKPCDAETLRTTVARACALRETIDLDGSSVVGKIEKLPSLPSVYHELIEVLQSDDGCLADVAKLIEQDPGITAKILQIVNSAYFGVRRQISSTRQAVSLLGLDNIRSLVLFDKIFAQIDQESLSQTLLEQLWGHGLVVGKLCQEIVFSRKADKQDADDALTAGLLHDCGKIVLVDNLGKPYRKLLNRFPNEEAKLYEAELQEFGTSHAEIGAYLLGLWGLPDPIVEAVAFHHRPGACLSQALSTLTVVHMANGIVNASNSLVIEEAGEEEGDDDGEVSPPNFWDPTYVEAVGMTDSIEHWREIYHTKVAQGQSR